LNQLNLSAFSCGSSSIPTAKPSILSFCEESVSSREDEELGAFHWSLRAAGRGGRNAVARSARKRKVMKIGVAFVIVTMVSLINSSMMVHECYQDEQRQIGR
jgi:hypothetical protein